MRQLAFAAVIVVALVGGAVASAPDRADWRTAFDRVNEALARRDPRAAAAAWREAHAAARAARSWRALLDSGDARLRIADLTDSGPDARATARTLYRDGFFRARSAQSIAGMRRAADGFAALGDHDAARMCLAAAQELETARSATAVRR